MTMSIVSAPKELEQYQVRRVEEQKKLTEQAEKLRADQELLVSRLFFSFYFSICLDSCFSQLQIDVTS